ncbi:MAG: hypothetical protein LBI28_02260 [Treponema sp.]|jgi:hypothetical protein|nr:hypothetical protein [Treponema sp.]
MDAQSVSYQKIVSVLKRRKKGATVADICSSTALPLATVNELLPKIADEYSGHLRVTQSGEILYYFPHGFTSRYKSFGTLLGRFARKVKSVIKKTSVFLFKFWIMIMLIGYFLLFIALALASVFISVASKSGSKGGRGGANLSFGLFELIWRIWFYSELTRPRDGYGNVKKKDKPKRPMHKSIFSFVFGEGEPNKDWDEKQSKAIITYIQANKGVICLPEYMAFTGQDSKSAESSIISFCCKYDGSPEVTEDGTIVYRFENLLLTSGTEKLDELIPPIKNIKTFSVNSTAMNGCFAVINTVNLIFGSYFLYQSLNVGQIINDFQYKIAPALYANTHKLLEKIIISPHDFIGIVLGLIPLTFSVLFWLIPIFRYFSEKKENEKIKMENFKRFSFNKIWSTPEKIESESFSPLNIFCCPSNFVTAEDRVIKDMGVISQPQVEVTRSGKTVYSFRELAREKEALKKYRSSVDMTRLKIGETVFDSDK